VTPALNDMFQATKAMMQMFSELQLNIDFKGNIIEVYNQKEINERRERSGKQVISMEGGISMKAEQIYNIPAEDILNKEKLFTRIKAMEFFTVFFGGVYGYRNESVLIVDRRNISQNFNYKLQIQTAISNDGDTKNLLLVGKHTAIEKDAIVKAFKEVPFVIASDIDFKSSYSGHYKLDTKTGWIQEATITLDEYISPTMHSSIHYQLNVVA
jgi:hypothetical protein